MYSNTMYTQKIIDEFNVLRQQPEIIRKACSTTYAQTNHSLRRTK